MKQSWIVDRLEQLGRTQAELARYLDIPAPRISEIVSGRRKIQIDELPSLAEYLGVTYPEAVKMILTGADYFIAIDPAPVTRVTVHEGGTLEIRGFVYAPVSMFDMRGPGGLSDDNASSHDYLFPQLWLRGITDAPSGLLSVTSMAGDSMAPSIRPGDHILVDRQLKRVGPDGIYVYTQSGEDFLQVRRFQRSSKTKLLTIRADNNEYASESGVSDKDIEIIGWVIWVGRYVGG